MRRQVTVSWLLFPVTLLYLLFSGGCASTAGYKKPVSDFQNASSVVTESARIYIIQLNKTQRDAYIDRQVSEAKQIKLNEIEASQVFSPEAIAARLGALNELSKYGTLLGQLANPDAPEQITGNAGDLANSLDRLEGTINHLHASGDREFKGAFGPASILIGEVARFAVEKKIKNALDKAIIGGEEPIKKLILVIRDDLEMAWQLKRSALTENRVIYVDGYEAERRKGHDIIRLRRRGDEIKSVLDLWEAFPSSNPREGFDALAAAHGALVDYARSPKKTEDLATFTSQMEDFAARAKRVGDSLKRLQQLNNN
jgi:hypothetical protein